MHACSCVQGPPVGTYTCSGGKNQDWPIIAPQIGNSNTPGKCLANGVNPTDTPAPIMVNEFGNGEITFYGPDVSDQCAGVCTAV